MQVSSHNSTFQTNPVVIQPIEQPEVLPTPKPELSPEDQLKVQKHIDKTKEAEVAQEQAKKDSQRALVTGYAGLESKKSQVEIYLAVATEDKVTLENNTLNSLDTLRDVQEQNQTIQAYATYQENQAS